jgi:hypothetical protein
MIDKKVTLKYLLAFLKVLFKHPSTSLRVTAHRHAERSRSMNIEKDKSSKL